MSQMSKQTLINLPVEMQKFILEYLDINSLFSMRSTCEYFKFIVDNHLTIKHLRNYQNYFNQYGNLKSKNLFFSSNVFKIPTFNSTDFLKP